MRKESKSLNTKLIYSSKPWAVYFSDYKSEFYVDYSFKCSLVSTEYALYLLNNFPKLALLKSIDSQFCTKLDDKPCKTSQSITLLSSTYTSCVELLIVPNLEVPAVLGRTDTFKLKLFAVICKPPFLKQSSLIDAQTQTCESLCTKYIDIGCNDYKLGVEHPLHFKLETDINNHVLTSSVVLYLFRKAVQFTVSYLTFRSGICIKNLGKISPRNCSPMRKVFSKRIRFKLNFSTIRQNVKVLSGGGLCGETAMNTTIF